MVAMPDQGDWWGGGEFSTRRQARVEVNAQYVIPGLTRLADLEQPMKIPSRQAAACTLSAAAVGIAALGAGVTAAGSDPSATAGSSASVARALSVIRMNPAPLRSLLATPDQVPPITSQCEATFQLDCFLPSQLQGIYNLPYLYGKNITGKSSTIVIIDAYGSPTISADLSTFDVNASVPDPPSFRIQRVGAVPAFDPNNGDMVSWAGETTLDVEYAHAMAPGASIVLVEAASDSFTNLLAADEYAINHRLGGVISESWGQSEQSIGASQVRSLSGVFAMSTSRYWPPRATRARPATRTTGTSTPIRWPAGPRPTRW
jgi:hypothetical protein